MVAMWHEAGRDDYRFLYRGLFDLLSRHAIVQSEDLLKSSQSNPAKHEYRRTLRRLELHLNGISGRHWEVDGPMDYTDSSCVFVLSALVELIISSAQLLPDSLRHFRGQQWRGMTPSKRLTLIECENHGTCWVPDVNDLFVLEPVLAQQQHSLQELVCDIKGTGSIDESGDGEWKTHSYLDLFLGTTLRGVAT